MLSKILNLIDIPWYSGVLEYSLLQSKALSLYGFDIFFAIPKTNEKYQEILKQYKTIEISDRKKILFPTEIIRIHRFIKENKIEVINAHTGRMQTFAYLISKIYPNIKIVRTKSDAKTIKKSFTYSNVKMIICGSKYIENMYKNIKNKPKTKTIYLSYPNQISTSPPNEKPFRISIIGRLDHIKGHENFIKAGLELLKKRNDIIFIIVGKEANIKWKDLSQLIPLNYKNYFQYLGFVDDINKVMRQSHLGIISSIGSEAVSRVAVEWMNNQRAVISSDAGCLPELIDRDFIYSKNDWRELASKIENNLELERLRKIGERNKYKFLQLFSFERFCIETKNIFESI